MDDNLQQMTTSMEDSLNEKSPLTEDYLNEIPHWKTTSMKDNLIFCARVHVLLREAKCNERFVLCALNDVWIYLGKFKK